MRRRLLGLALELLTDHLIERLAARRWLPRTQIGPLRIGRYAIALAATTDTTDTMGDPR